MKTLVTAADVRHREDFKDFVIDEADKEYRPALRRLYFLWEQYAKSFFEDSMVPPYILLASPSLPQAFGDYSKVSGFGGHSQIRIRPTLLTGAHRAMKEGERYAKGRLLFVADVLLHETIHQYHHEVTGHPEDSYKGHGPAFRDVCNEIGEKLGLAPVRVAKARGPEKDLPSCAEWPHCVRPKNYYQGAYIPPAGKKGAKDFDDELSAKLAVLREMLKGDRSGSIVNLIEAAQSFARFWPEGTEADALSLLTDVDGQTKRKLAAFLRAAQEVSEDL